MASIARPTLEPLDPRPPCSASGTARPDLYTELYWESTGEGPPLLLVMGMGRVLFDRDTAPGAEPEDMMRLDVPALVVPGRDAAHAISAARYLEECLPKAQFWDVPADEQTAANAPARMLEFLDAIKP